MIFLLLIGNPALQVNSTDMLARCFVDDSLLLEFLQYHAAVPGGALVLISSGKHLISFPLVCSVYNCVHKSQVWDSAESPLKHSDSTLVLAYMDFLLAKEACAFYGNRFSSFSQELVAEFQDLGRPTQYYNPLSRPASDREGA